MTVFTAGAKREWSDRNRPPPACLLDDAVRLVGVGEVVIGNRWQARFANARADCGCHDPTIAQRESQTIRYNS
jgi:hypothetical protein